MSDPRPRRPRLDPLDVLAHGVVGLRSRPLRAALSALGIAIGIATMVVVVGIPASSQQALDRELSALGTNLLRAQATMDERTNALPPVPEQADAMVERIGPVTQASAAANTHAQVRRTDKIPPEQSSGLTVLAVRPDLLRLLDAELVAGTPITRENEGLPVTVLGATAASRLGITSLPPGQPAPKVWINNRWFTVVGILAATPLDPEVERSVLVGWGAARTWLGFDGHPTVIYARAVEEHLESVRDVLPATVYPENPARIKASRPSDALAAKRIAETTFSGLFLGLAAVALLVGGVGVANTMVISVLERKREVGLRRALGATKGQIRTQFLTESVVLCLFGGLTGVLLGVLGTAVYSAIKSWPAVVPLDATLGGLGSSMAIGALAGLYPAIRAARLTPTEALAAP